MVTLNIMGYVNRSEVNGPGSRAVVWVQGCLRACTGCFNPASWPFEPNQIVTVDELVERILADPLNEGVTFSGGEPFWQATALAVVRWSGCRVACANAPAALTPRPGPLSPTKS
jgi:anaerobic ribonucleoside-triphosphate reductase activating protein